MYESFKFLADNVNSSVMIIEVNGKEETLMYANDIFYNFWGIKKEDYRFNFKEFEERIVLKEAVISLRKSIERSYITGEPQKLYYEIVNLQGKHIWIRKQLVVMKTSEKNNYILAMVATDITTQKQAEDQNRDEKNRFEFVVEQTGVAVIEWNFASNNFFGTKSYEKYEMSKLNQDDIFRNKGSLDTVHPKDVGIIKDFFKKCTLDLGKAETVLRLKMVDGTYRWSKIVTMPVKDETGKRVKVIGAIIDLDNEITAQSILKKRYENTANYVKILGKKAALISYVNLTKETITHIVNNKKDVFATDKIYSLDVMFESVYSKILDESEREEFKKIFNYKNMINSYNNGIESLLCKHHFRKNNFYFETKCQLTKNPITNDIEAFFLVTDISEEYKLGQAIGQLISLGYESIIAIDVDTGKIDSLKLPNKLNSLMLDQKNIDNYNEGLKHYILRLCIADEMNGDLDELINELSLENIKKMLDKNDTYYKVYSVVDGKNEVRKKRAFYTYLNKYKDTIVCSIIDITI